MYGVGMSDKTFLREHMKCTANIKEETWSISFNSMSIREDLFNDDTLILLNQYRGGGFTMKCLSLVSNFQ